MNEHLLDLLPPSVRSVIFGTMEDICKAAREYRNFESPKTGGMDCKPVFMFEKVVVKLGYDAIKEARYYEKLDRRFPNRIVKSCPIPAGIVMERCDVIADVFGSPYYTSGFPKCTLKNEDIEWLFEMFADITGDAHVHNIGIDSRGHWVLIDFGLINRNLQVSY